MVVAHDARYDPDTMGAYEQVRQALEAETGRVLPDRDALRAAYGEVTGLGGSEGDDAFAMAIGEYDDQPVIGGAAEEPVPVIISTLPSRISSTASAESAS